MPTLEFKEIVAELHSVSSKIDQLQRLQRQRCFLKIIGIGFLLYRNVVQELKVTYQRKQHLLARLESMFPEQVNYFRAWVENIKDANEYIPNDVEKRLLNELEGLEKAIEYLTVHKVDYSQKKDLSIELAQIRSFILSYNVELERRKLKEKLLSLKSEVLQAENEFNSLYEGTFYFSKRDLFNWKAKYSQLIDEVELIVGKGITADFESAIRRIIDAYREAEGWLKVRNQEFIKKESVVYEEFFAHVESKPLTDEQKRAIITDEANNLVVAGAGTGKTSTIVGKAGYLIKKGLAKPEEILLLTFNKNVATELETRVKKRLNEELVVKTYHAFGLQIVAQSSKEKPSVSSLAEDKVKFSGKILEFLNNRMKEKAFADLVNSYFLFYQIPYKSAFEFESFGEYIRYMRQFDLRSLKGERVKSFEECYIANFLYLNGIDYLYETPYEIKTVDTNHRQYKPDFYLPKYEIYIEHFGITRDGKPAPHISESKYRSSMSWKRTVHSQHETTLIETFSYEQKEGVLLSNLEEKLLEKGVKFSPVSSDEIFAELNNLGKVNQFADLLCSFLNLFKSCGKNLDQIIREIDPKDVRTISFLKIFSAIYEDYTTYLKKTQEIDFNDMLNYATILIKEGNYLSNFKYILVDEFQDISYSRYLFLKALADQNQTKLFCVGDDWQSIYRFTGSDISLMAEFDKKFEFTEICFLQQTFRFNNRICDFSTQFILKNPLQIKKTITSTILKEQPAVCIIRKNTSVALKELLSHIAKKSEKERTAFVIGRYNHLEQEYLRGIPRKIGSLKIEYATAHSSKGLEADYVIIIGLTGGKLGFPCQIVDDPLLNLVLAKEDPYPNAEERRLFYVAVTRAKNQVYLINDPAYNSSSFISEILNKGYDIESIGQLPKTALCPICKTGEIIPKESKHGTFHSCSNYPYCDYIPRRCPECKTGYLQKGQYVYKCANQNCTFKAYICPLCNEGYLTKKANRKGGYFYGCNKYPQCKYIKRPNESRYYIR